MTKIEAQLPAVAEPEVAPLVSVIIPVYNQARFLAEAIASAQAQTVPPHEIIVVDDGSTDDVVAVIGAFRAVRLIRHANLGLAAARNTGWRAARGQYLVFLDADDRLLAQAISANLERFAREPDCAFVYGGYQFIDREGRAIGPPIAGHLEADGYEGFLRGNPVGMHATVMYRRDRVEEVGGFDAALEACEDYDLMLRLARHHRVAFGPEVIAEYRQHGDNMSEDVPMMLGTALRVLRRHAAHVAGHPTQERALVEGLRCLKEYYAGEALTRLRVAVRDRGPVLRRALTVARVFAVAPVSVFRGAVVEIWRRRPWRRRSSPPGTVNFGDLRRLEPFSLDFGFDRGRPIDRGYIEEFLARHRRDVRGRVLEVGDDGYTRQFGGPAVVTHDVLHVDDGNARATLVGDLADGRDFPSNAFDCIILTQTLHLVFDLRAAVATLHRMLKAGGVLLVTVPGVSNIDRGEWGATWYWSLTPAALQRLLEERFGREGVAVSCQGNVLAATAFLYGLVDSELEREKVESPDPHYPVIVAARAVKRTGPE